MTKIFEKNKYRIKYKNGYYNIYKRTIGIFWFYWDRRFGIYGAKNRIDELIDDDKRRRKEKVEKHWLIENEVNG